jgi:hypothetical protein
VVGYTGAGFVAAGLGFDTRVPLMGTARLIVDVALALLLFEIGSRVRLRWLRFNPALLWSSLMEALVSGVETASAPALSQTLLCEKPRRVRGG